jgi:hypothetical protein
MSSQELSIAIFYLLLGANAVLLWENITLRRKMMHIILESIGKLGEIRMMMETLKNLPKKHKN